MHFRGWYCGKLILKDFSHLHFAISCFFSPKLFLRITSKLRKDVRLKNKLLEKKKIFKHKKFWYRKFKIRSKNCGLKHEARVFVLIQIPDTHSTSDSPNLFLKIIIHFRLKMSSELKCKNHTKTLAN